MSARPRWAWALPSDPLTLPHDLRVLGGAGSACWPATPQPSGGAPAGARKSPHRDSCRTRSWAPHPRRPPDRSPSCPPPSAQSQGADSPGHRLLGRAQAVWDEGGDRLRLCQTRPLGARTHDLLSREAGAGCVRLRPAASGTETPRSRRLHPPRGSTPAVHPQRQGPRGGGSGDRAASRPDSVLIPTMAGPAPCAVRSGRGWPPAPPPPVPSPPGRSVDLLTLRGDADRLERGTRRSRPGLACARPPPARPRAAGQCSPWLQPRPPTGAGPDVTLTVAAPA